MYTYNINSWWKSGATRLSRFNSSWDLFGSLLSQIIQAKEGEALRQTLQTMVWEMSDQIRRRTLLCKVDNQALKAIIEKKGSTRMLPLNKMGKQIFWMQQSTEFFLQLEYVKSEVNVADKYTSSLMASSQVFLRKLFSILLAS